MGFLKRRGRSKEPSATKPAAAEGPQFIFLEPPTTPKTPTSPQMPTSSTNDVTNDVEFDPIRARVSSYIHGLEKESREPMSVAPTVKTEATQSTIVASGSRRVARSIDPVVQREPVPRSIHTRSNSPSRRSHRTGHRTVGNSQSPRRPHPSSSSRSPSHRSHRSHRSISPSLRKSRSTTPRRPKRIDTTYVHPPGSSQRKSRSLTPRSLLTLPKSPQQRDSSPSTPKSMSTMVVGHGSQRGTRSIRIESPSSRSRSVEPSMRRSRSTDTSKIRGKSAEPNRNEKRESSKSPRSMNRFLRFSPTSSILKNQPKILQDSKSNDTADTTKDGLLFSRTRSSEMQNPNPASSAQMLSMANLVEVTPFYLDRDMTFLADGMNLDRNTRYLLAAFDARTIDDFYLMSDRDFSNFIQKARSTKNELPPLQIRKVQMLRAWIKEVVDDHLNDDHDGRRRRKRNFRIVPKDWKEQYKNDLPHLKLQLRNQGDSIFERFRSLMACGAYCY